MEIEKASLAFLGLSHPIRLQIFNLIVHSGDTGLRPQEIMLKVEIPHATLSFHLKQLQIANLVWVVRKGTRLFYHCNEITLGNVSSELMRLNENKVTLNNAIITKPRIKIKPQLSIKVLKEQLTKE